MATIKSRSVPCCQALVISTIHNDKHVSSERTPTFTYLLTNCDEGAFEM